jgi:hypothetical protein
MEEFVFAGNQRRWQYLRPCLGVTFLGAGLWSAALCWALLKSPTLPDLGPVATSHAVNPSFSPGSGSGAQTLTARVRLQ